MTGNGRKVVFLVTEDSAFLRHRLPMARAVAAMGAEVVVAARLRDGAAAIERHGFRVVPIGMARGNSNPLRELVTVAALVRMLWRERPDVLHNVSLKPVLDGSLAACLAPVGHVVNTFTGLGTIFTGMEGLGVLRRMLPPLLRLLLRIRPTTAIVQNEDDGEELLAWRMLPPQRIALIRGSGVDPEAFPYRPEPDGPVTVTMVSRLLWDKGIAEFVEAARRLRAGGRRDLRFVVAGMPDPENPRTVDDATLTAWRAEGDVDFVGERTDVAALWAETHIAVLPSYREGTPKSMLEAASCGRPLIVADVPGCRQLVRDGVTGLVVPARDGGPLAEAIRALAEDGERRRELGRNARQDVLERYADAIVERDTRALYERIWHDRSAKTSAAADRAG